MPSRSLMDFGGVAESSTASYNAILAVKVS